MDKYKLKFENNNSKYIQIYNHIKQLIVQGQIKEHEKLPPIRKLADYINVNNVQGSMDNTCDKYATKRLFCIEKSQ